MPHLQLKDKVAVVTGAGSGIGCATACLFAEQGARVAAMDRDEKAQDAVVGRIKAAGGRAEGFVCDVSVTAAVHDAFEDVLEKFGRLDILVNNAGVAHVGNVENTREEDFDRLYRVNVKGVYLCTREAIPAMVKGGGGVIVNMASIASLIGVADRFAYSMSKGAVLAMTRSTALDYVKKNIRCNCICPARVHTPFVDGFVAKNYPGKEKEKLEELSKYQPLGRMGTPEEVAFMALYLACDESSFVTGQAFPLDGGVLMG